MSALPALNDARQVALYAWQERALRSWAKANRQGVVEAVTGTGKTRVGQVAIQAALAEGRRAMVLVPTKELQRQWRRSLRRDLPGSIRIGQLGDGHADTFKNHQVVVSIVNSMRDGNFAVPNGSLLVADECHRYAPPENRRALRKEFTQRLGLTATLDRPDHAEHLLLKYFGPVCCRIGYARALADGVVSPFTVALIGVPMSPEEAAVYQKLSKEIANHIRVLTEQHGFPRTPYYKFMRAVTAAATRREWTSAKGPARAFLGAVGERRQLMGLSASKLDLATKLAPAIWSAERTIVFTESVHLSEVLAEEFRAQRLGAKAIHSDLGGDERRRIFQQFAVGDLRVIVAPRVLDEGIDVPAADLAIVVSGSRTRRQMVQRMGRVLRRKEDERLARIAILFLEGTTEDPARGAHEAFLSEVTTVAEDRDDFESDELEEALAFLCTYDPFQPLKPPRMAGEPARPFHSSDYDEASLALNEFLGLVP